MSRASMACALVALASGACAHRIGRGRDVFARFEPTFGAARRGAAGLGLGLLQMEAPDFSYEVALWDSEVEAHEDGAYMAANGQVHGVAASRFMMKGTAGSLSGWVVMEDEEKAYEYTTAADGEVAVAEVPMEKVKSVCTASHPPAEAAGEGGRDASGQEAHETGYQGQDLRYLQSLPGAAVVLWLDIETYWSNKRRNDNVKNHGKEYFYQNWQSVAAGFSMFNLNVVYDKAVYDRTPMRNRGRACFHNGPGFSHAYTDTIGSNSCGSNNYHQSGGFAIGRVSLHEAGHMFGLNHDGIRGGFLGIGGAEYYAGNQRWRWGSIMGQQWEAEKWGAQHVLQWSKGDYDRANNQQDDLRLIGRYVSRRADDITGSRRLRIASNGRVAASQNGGKITDRTDSDAWTFTIGPNGGTVNLVVDRTEYLGGSMLDVDATLRRGGSRGSVVRQSNPTADRRAFIRTSLAAGEYTLVIRGGAEGTPQDGFDAYGSLGNYGIAGTVVTVLGPPPTPAPPVRTPSPPTPVPGATYLTLRSNNGGVADARLGFVSDGWAPNEYPAETDVSLTIAGANCELRWLRFDLEDATQNGCEYDYVLVTAGATSQKYCGGTLPSMRRFEGTSRVEIALHSDQAVQGRGFEMEFRCEDVTDAPATLAPTPMPTPRPVVTPAPTQPTPSPPVVTSTPPQPTPSPPVVTLAPTQPTPSPPVVTPAPTQPTPSPPVRAQITLRNNAQETIEATSGTISDGYATYPAERDLSVTVIGGSCELRWTSFDVEDSGNCIYDFVEVQSGGASLGKWCGGALPPTVRVSGDDVTVLLHSDEGVEAAGFVMEFACEPLPPPPRDVRVTLRQQDGSVVRGQSGTISDGWATYPANVDRAVTVVGRSCALTWRSFDVEAASDCIYDFVELLEGARSLGKWCGSMRPPNLTVDGESFTVLLHSDEGVEAAGFVMDFACAEP